MFGAKIIKRACEEPVRQIAINAGLDGAIVVDRILQEKSVKAATGGFSRVAPWRCIQRPEQPSRRLHT